jgi:Ca2+-binding EF-hand superfamily protein
MPEQPAWERIQMKTFTKWCNNHLKKSYGTGEGCQVNDILTDWESGILLIKLAVALYKENEKEPEKALKMPKLKPMELSAKSRIQKVQNGSRAISMMKSIGVDLRSVSAENLCDHDKVAILGMIWIIILDYAARGFGGTASEVKRALLEWVNKKTDGYERVNPPGVKNFTKDWRSGLAWCALIHAHRPELIDYEDCLTKSNAENLETAFSVAEEHVGIPRLLDVEDVDTDAPDDKSIMTYVMEYFHAFAGENLKEAAAAQAAEWLKLLRQIMDLQHDYERRARELVAWTGEQKASWDGFNFGDTKAEATAAFDALRAFVTDAKPAKEAEKMDLESLFASIQTLRKVNNLKPYVPPEGLAPNDMEDDFMQMVNAQNAHGGKVRENVFRFTEKVDDSAAEHIEAEIAEAFDRYDGDKNGHLLKNEFEAACMEMGLVFKTQDDKDALFNSVAKGDDKITKDEFFEWMRGRLVVRLDDPAGIKAAFTTIADNNENGITEAQLKTKPLSPEDLAFLQEHMPKNEDGTLNFSAYVDETMN